MLISQNCEALNKTALLSSDELENPMLVIKSFFIEMKLPELRKLFQDILETCLTTENHPFCEAEMRFELLLHIKKIECLIEATSIIAEKIPKQAIDSSL